MSATSPWREGPPPREGVATPEPGRWKSLLPLPQARVDALAGLQQFLHRVDRDLEIGPGLIVQRDLDDLLDAAGANHAGDADIEAVQAIFAVDISGSGQEALLVAKIGLGHGDAAGGGRVISRAGSE